jgi:hypothetical protein
MAWHIRKGPISTDRVQVVIDGAFSGVLHRICLFPRHPDGDPDQTRVAFARVRGLHVFQVPLLVGICIPFRVGHSCHPGAFRTGPAIIM